MQIQQIVEKFELMASTSLVEQARHLVTSGEAYWSWDPQVETTIGLLFVGTNRAAVVIYDLGEDFESDLG